MKTFSTPDILNRLKSALSVSTDTELADLLGIKKATLSNWRNRNSIDLPLVFSFCERINIDWLMTGDGNMLKQEEKSNLIAAEPDQKYKAESTPIVENAMIERFLMQIKDLAEEIGRLKERIKQLEHEKNMAAKSFRPARQEVPISQDD